MTSPTIATIPTRRRPNRTRIWPPSCLLDLDTARSLQDECVQIEKRGHGRVWSPDDDLDGIGCHVAGRRHVAVGIYARDADDAEARDEARLDSDDVLRLRRPRRRV